MKRQAILIAASPASDPAPGVYPDIISWDAFLRSRIGGAWLDEEILNASNHPGEELCKLIKSVGNVDYSMIIFAGHAKRVRTEMPWTELQILLGTGESILERELNPGTARCSMILDCCRTGSLEERQDFSIKKAAVLENKEELSIYREAYNTQLASAEGGLVKVYSTEDGVDAIDENTFSQHLVLQANIWADRYHGVLNLRDGVRLASDSIAKFVPQQKPEYQGGRRLNHFPLAVSL